MGGIMNFPYMPDAHLLSVDKVVFTGQDRLPRAHIDSMVRRDMARQLAEELVHTEVKVLEGDHTRTYRMRVYVMTEDTLARVIYEAAAEMWPPVVRMEPPAVDSPVPAC